MKTFISYSRVDKPIVEDTIIKPLRFAGIEAWFDYFLPVGQDWKSTLIKAITQCDIFIYALTPESLISFWCQWECGKASELNKPIVPVVLQKNINIPPNLIKLESIQWADFTNGATVEAISRFLGGLYSLDIPNIVNPIIDTYSLEKHLNDLPPQALDLTAPKSTDGNNQYKLLSQDEKIIKENTQSLREIIYFWADIMGDLYLQIPELANIDIKPWYIFDSQLVLKIAGDTMQDIKERIQEVIKNSLNRFSLNIDKIVLSNHE